MWERVKVVTKPTGLAVSLEDAKDRLEVEHAFHDAKITGMINGAIARIDGPSGIGFALLQQTWRKTFDAFPCTIELPGAPIQSVTEIKYLDSDGVDQTLAPEDYRVDLSGEPARIEPAIGKAWPATYSAFAAVSVDYQLGESDATDLPADLVDAMHLIIGHRYENREAVTAGGAAAPLPLGVEWILREHNRIAVTA